MIKILPLTGIREVAPGDDLPEILAEALTGTGIGLEAGDILVVTQKIVSKAEGRFDTLSHVKPSQEAERLAAITYKDPRLVELVLSESTAVLRAVPNVLITRHRLGLVMANAGINRSNIGPGGEDRALLLPRDHDASARRIYLYLGERTGITPAVVISDSFGRPWRCCVVCVGTGARGLSLLIDRWRGLARDVRKMEVTHIGLADIRAT